MELACADLHQLGRSTSEINTKIMRVQVKYAGVDVDVEGLEQPATVGQLKERLEERTGVFARHQKLIFKGKVLEDKSTLAAAGMGDGAKLMLLASANAAQARPRAAAAPPSAGGRPAASSARPTPAGRGVNVGSSGGGAASARPASLPERRASWQKMGVVALRDLGLAEVPAGCFEGLADVRGADLSQNCLTAIPADVSRLASLGSLRLSENALRDEGLPWEALAGLRGLTLLALDGNELTRLPAALGGCSALVRLSAAGNRIVSVDEAALAGLPALREVDVSRNALAALPESVGCCSALEDLAAGDNRLAAIPRGVTRLGRLQNLRMDNNRIKELPPGLFCGCTSLAALLLRGNPITVEALRAAQGFAEYDTRRRARTDKQLGGRVVGDLPRAFCEGADVDQWEHHKR